jgi:hypothetical protein
VAGLPETLSSSAPAKEVLILGVNELMVASSVSIFFLKKKITHVLRQIATFEHGLTEFPPI